MSSVTYTFSPSTTAASAQVNQNFTDCINAINQNTPSGLIALWSGAIASIPVGWYLCDGTNGTPDLRDRFVIGAGNSYAVAATGGSTTKNMPHTHGTYMSGNCRRGSGDANAQDSGVTLTSDNGTMTAQDIMPPYYALAFIMKS